MSAGEELVSVRENCLRQFRSASSRCVFFSCRRAQQPDR
jgi:hypothetical protein